MNPKTAAAAVYTHAYNLSIRDSATQTAARTYRSLFGERKIKNKKKQPKSLARIPGQINRAGGPAHVTAGKDVCIAL